jgi:hypothetical protein
MKNFEPPERPTVTPVSNGQEMIVLEPRKGIRGPFRKAFIDDQGRIVPYGPVIDETPEAAAS